MKKIIGIILLLVAFAFTADVRPFVFDNVSQDLETQQDQWETLVKYKLWGTIGIYLSNEGSLAIEEQNGYTGTAHGNINAEKDHHLGGPIIIGGKLTIGTTSQLTNIQLAGGPVRADTIRVPDWAAFQMSNSIFDGPYCVKSDIYNNGNAYDYTVDVLKSKITGGYYVGENYDQCPVEVPLVDTALRVPTVNLDTVSNWEPGIDLAPTGENIVIGYIHVPPDSVYTNEYGTVDKFLTKLRVAKVPSFRIYVVMPPTGRLTRIFVKDGFELDNSPHNPRIQVMYVPEGNVWNKSTNQWDLTEVKDSTKFTYVEEYQGNLLFYTDKRVDWGSTDGPVYQGTFITTDTMRIGNDFSVSGQLIAKYIYIRTPYLGKFKYVPFDPPVIDIDPTALASGKFVENNIDVTLPVKLDIAPITNVTFNYCYKLKDTVGVASIADFNNDIPVCGVDSGEVKILKGTKTPLVSPILNVKIDDIAEYDERLILYVFNLNGAVMPNKQLSGYFNLTITDGGVFQIDTTKTYSVDENIANVDIGIISVIGKTDSTKLFLIPADTTKYTLDSLTGLLTLKLPYDYETTQYDTITVIANDTTMADTTKLVIGIKDVNEAPNVDDQTLTFNETDIIVGKITYTEPDTKSVFTNDIVKAIGGDTALFIVDNTGEIKISDKFVKPNKDTTYSLVVITQDKTNPTLVDTATITLDCKNVNDIPVLQPNDTLKVPENCDTCFVGIIIAIDPDKNDTLFYDVKEPGFKIDNTGKLTTTKPFDLETTPTVTITVVVKDSSGATDTKKYVITITNVNEPVHVDDKTCTIKENYVGNVCQIPATDEDKDSITYIVIDNPNYEFKDDTLVIKNPIDFEKKTKDTVKVIVTDGEFPDTASIVINIIDEKEDVKITAIDNEPKKDTIKTNDPNHNIEWKLCEGIKCDYDTLDVVVKKDTTIKVCNEKKTVCDSVVILFNDAPPVVTLTNANSTNALIDYITIEEEKDDKIYVNKKNNEITVTVKDTVHKTEKHFNIEVTLDTIATKDIKLTEYNYIIDETKAKVVPIGNNLAELVEVIKVDGIEVELKQVIDTKTGKPVDTVQTVTYTKKVNGKDVVVSYKTDNLTGQKIGDYEVSYMIDSCTKVTYSVDDNKKIVKNKEGNIAYTIAYEYTDDYGNKASAKVEIIFDDIPPKVEILNPTPMESFNTNAIPVKWTVNGEVQDTLTLQRLEKGVNHIIRRYVDKAGNVAEDTITVIMREAKDIDITLVHPVTKVDKDKVDEYYSEGHKYNDKKPYDVKFVDPKNDSLPDVIGVGFKVDIVLPSVSPTGSLATLDDIVKNGMIPVDDKGNIVGASTKGIPVETYVSEHCTDEFKEDYKKNGLNIPLYDVTYNLHLWVYTNNANYVNDFNIEFTLNDEAKTTSAGTVQMVIDWLSDKDGNVKAKNGHALGTGAYITKLWSKSIAKHRCDYKEQKKGDRTVKKDDTMKIFGYKRPNDK